VERAADLVISLGGSLSGEHGDGQARGELLERMYGPELVDAFRQVKTVFDPRGRMNPGKVVDPYPLDTNLRYGPSYALPQPTVGGFFALADDSGSLQHAAERCVGVGRCRRDDTGVMCPSYRATRDERHSTRGRAKLLVELFQGEVTKRTWRNKEVREALDLCLACKGCAVDCPTHVDMATYKAEFLAHHYQHRLRPRAMYALALTPWLVRLGARVPALTNAALHTSALSSLVRRVAGVTTHRPAPVIASPTLRRKLRNKNPAPITPSVVLWPDTFTDAYRPEVGEAWRAILEAVGERVAVPTQWACCARPLYDAGMLKLAKHTLRDLLDALDQFITNDIPIIVPEPSCLAAFRDELPALLTNDPRAAKLASLSRSPAEHLLTLPPEALAPLTLTPPTEPRTPLTHAAHAAHGHDPATAVTITSILTMPAPPPPPTPSASSSTPTATPAPPNPPTPTADSSYNSAIRWTSSTPAAAAWPAPSASAPSTSHSPGVSATSSGCLRSPRLSPPKQTGVGWNC
jgi:Fe-S oxidoreductase